MSRKPRLRARDRRALLLGLAVLAPAALYRVGISPWLEYRTGLREALVAERDLLGRERAALAEAVEQPAREAALRASLEAAEPWLLDGASAMAASGALSRRLTESGRAAGILIQEVQTRPTEGEPGPLEAVSVTVRALGDLEGILRFLHSVESGALLLEVGELTLRTAGVNDGDLERGQVLSASLVITGHRLRAQGEDVMGAAVEARP